MVTQALPDSGSLPGSTIGSNLPEQSVGDLSRALKRTVEDQFGRVRVRGEISGLKRAASGHLYLALKDSEAVMDAVCWRGSVSRLSLRPEDGMEVICVGRVTTYMERSKYQLVIESIELAGEGALLKLLEDRRKKLAAEGLFDQARKKPIPYLPAVIGVVTSPTGAVIRDILHRLADRFPRHVLVWPVLVQGEGAAAQVAAAIEGFNRLQPDGKVPRPDVLIVARGGGSLEDLWAFNEEIVVRAAAASAIPLISAVGHETDTTLIDYASDRRAPTPTAAAEIAVPVRAELLANLQGLDQRLTACARRQVVDRRTRLADLVRGLPRPREVLEECSQRLDGWTERLGNAARVLLDDRQRRVAHGWAALPRPEATLSAARRLAASVTQRLRPELLGRRFEDGEHRVQDLFRRLTATGDRTLGFAQQRLASVSGLLESYSYERVLERGFVLVRDAHGKPVTAAAEAKSGERVELRFHDGTVGATVGGAPTAPSPSRSPRKTTPEGSQGSLL